MVGAVLAVCPGVYLERLSPPTLVSGPCCSSGKTVEYGQIKNWIKPYTIISAFDKRLQCWYFLMRRTPRTMV